MAVRAERTRVRWWQQFPRRVHQQPEKVAEIIRLAARTRNPFPHVRLRLVEGKTEPFLPGTGLTVWEIAWLWRVHHGDMEALMRHFKGLPITRDIVEEALAYSSEHAAEIDAQVAAHTERSLEDLLELLPGMRVLTFEADGPGGHDA